MRRRSESYDHALTLKPDHAEASGNRGNALTDLKRYEAAIASFDRAIASRPDFAEAHFNLGNVLQRAFARHTAADASYARKRSTGEARLRRGAYCNRGNVLRSLKRFDEAVASYDRAIALDPGTVAETYTTIAAVR